MNNPYRDFWLYIKVKKGNYDGNEQYKLENTLPAKAAAISSLFRYCYKWYHIDTCHNNS